MKDTTEKVSKSAAGRVVDHLALLLVFAPVTRRHCPDTVLIVESTLVPMERAVAYEVLERSAQLPPHTRWLATRGIAQMRSLANTA